MHPRTTVFRRSPKILIVPNTYIIITREGLEFVKEKYSCSGALDSGETRLYLFLIRLLSFHGILPLNLMGKWRISEILEKARENHYVTVTPYKRKLPKKEVQEAAKEIWGKIPRSIYV